MPEDAIKSIEPSVSLPDIASAPAPMPTVPARRKKNSRISIQTWVLAGLMLVCGATLIFNLDPWGQRLVLRGHQGPVIGAAFSHDEKRIATTSRDGTIRTWDLKSGRELSRTQSVLAASARAPLTGAARQIHSYNDTPAAMSSSANAADRWATFSDSGNLLVTGNSETYVTIWERRRPAGSFGITAVPEFWVTLLLSIALNWSLWTDLRGRRLVPVRVKAKA